MIAALSFFGVAQKTDDFLVTPNSVGRVSLGMTFGSARKIWADFTFIRLNEYSGSAPVAVMEANKILMIVSTDQKKYHYARMPLGDDARIQMIQVLDERYRTAEGLHPNMSVINAEKIYGKVEKIIRNSIGLTEHARFGRQPSMDIRIANKQAPAGFNYKRPVKRLGTVNYETEQYASSSYVERITISIWTNLTHRETQKK